MHCRDSILAVARAHSPSLLMVQDDGFSRNTKSRKFNEVRLGISAWDLGYEIRPLIIMNQNFFKYEAEIWAHGDKAGELQRHIVQ